ncbi:MAG: hypothetical protein ACYC5A_06690 [Thermoleophilia bacterium]
MKNSKASIVMVIALVLMLSLGLAACGEEEVDVDKIIEKATDEVMDNQGTFDACKYLTQEDASALFGKEAVEGTPNTPLMLGECVWEWDSDTSNQSIILMAQAGEIYYVEGAGTEPVDVGEKGNIEVNEAADMIFIQWVQDGNTYALNYFSIGDDMPDILTMGSDVEALAKKISAAL